MEISIINNTTFCVLYEDDKRKIIQDVSSFRMDGLNKDICLLDNGFLHDIEYIEDYLETIIKSKFKSDYLEMKINTLTETLSIMESLIRDSIIDAVINEPFNPCLAC